MKPLPLILVAVATFALIKQASLLGMSDGRDPVVWGGVRCDRGGLGRGALLCRAPVWGAQQVKARAA